MKKFFLISLLLFVAILAGFFANIYDLNLAGFLIFIILLATIVYNDKSKVKIEGIMIIRRTEKFRDTIDKIARSHPSFWKKMSVLGVIVSIILIVVGSFFMIASSYGVLTGQKEGGAKLVLPAPVANPVNAPGVLLVQWWVFIIAIAVVVIPHETFHGIMCRLDKVKIKSVGWALMAIIPAAFVEPDEEQLKKAKRSTKMKIYAAGSFANMITAFIVVFIVALITTFFFTPNGIFVSTIEGTPANLSALQGSIYEINGNSINSLESLKLELSKYKSGDLVTVKTYSNNKLIPSVNFPNIFDPKPLIVSSGKTNEYKIKLADKDGKAFLGVNVIDKSYSTSLPVSIYNEFAKLLFWLFVFSFGIGMVNMLPIKPLDGGLLFEEIVGYFVKDENTRNKVVKYISIFMVLLLAFNVVGPVLLGL